MAYVIGSILVVIALIILGLILRKKVYDDVDRLEGWKMDIMNRNVTSELAKVKSLNLSGETQENFESWKERWDRILTRELPDIEEFLLDAEEAADRFRVRTAKKNLKTVNETLQVIEKEIQKMFDELDHLLASEQSSREEIEEIEPRLKELKKFLLQQRHLYGKAEIRFEVEIDELTEKIGLYYELTDNGDYFEAQEVVNEVKDKLNITEGQIKDYPVVYKKCRQEIPGQIEDLLSGIKTMKADGYRIEHYGFEKELHTLQESLLEIITKLETGDVSEIFELVIPIEERIAEMYKLLEKEAIAKSYVEKQLPGYRQLIEEVAQDFDDTKNEVKHLQETYYFEERDMELHLNLEKWMKQLHKQYEQIEKELEETEGTSHTEIRDLLETGHKELLELQESHDEFKDQVHAFRKDELEAKESVLDMRKQLYSTNRKLQKSNIPGVPGYIWGLLEETTGKADKVVEKLEKQPLDMGEVQQSLSEAQEAVQLMIEKTDVLLDQARLVEIVIQYANRYRSQYPHLAEKLYESEVMFRNYEYENALEEAVKALEEIEPGALKRLEEFSKVPS